jgi:L-aspartate oxidase
LGDPAPLATEALRGEGAWLVNAKGERFMTDIHADAELAPRDVVARAVFRERQRSGFVGLDLRRDALSSFTDNFDQHFPTVAATCKKAGLDPRRDILPVAPAAHYHMGGVRTDINGRASLEGLWVCGEAASTGAHGANRLASNSLLEALVFAARIAQDVNNLIPWRSITTPQPPQSQLSEQDENALPTIHKLRSMMSAHVGVERDEAGLRDMLIHLMRLEKASMGRAPLINMVSTALLITAAAYQRQESRGAHFRKDFAHHSPNAVSSDLTLDEARAIAKNAKNRLIVNPPAKNASQVR